MYCTIFNFPWYIEKRFLLFPAPLLYVFGWLQGGKMWGDSDPDAAMKFFEATSDWYSTWNGKDAAMQVQYDDPVYLCFVYSLSVLSYVVVGWFFFSDVVMGSRSPERTEAGVLDGCRRRKGCR